MADFLTRLAGRTLGVVPTVQPMITPLYAPESTLLAGQTSLPVFEEISGGAPVQHPPSHWPAGWESIDLPGREPLHTAPAAQGPEQGANIFTNPASFSPRHDTTFPPAGVTQAGAAQSALPSVSGDISVHSRHTPPSIFVTGGGSQPGAPLPLTSTFTTGEPGTAHHMPLSSMSMTSEVARSGASVPLPSQFITSDEGVPGAGTPLPSQYIIRKGGQPGSDISLALAATPLPAPDKTNPLQMREVHVLTSQLVQEHLESASFTGQDDQGSDVPRTVINVNSVEGQRTAGPLPRSALPADSSSRASIRRAAADAATSRLESSQEGAAPTIQVTIGRIEVRATQPPPAQRQAPRPGPRMVSLEEYLNQQAKGGQ